jgi:hypothetical protein
MCDGRFRCLLCPDGCGVAGRGFKNARSVPCSNRKDHLAATVEHRIDLSSTDVIAGVEITQEHRQRWKELGLLEYDEVTADAWSLRLAPSARAQRRIPGERL